MRWCWDSDGGFPGVFAHEVGDVFLHLGGLGLIEAGGDDAGAGEGVLELVWSDDGGGGPPVMGPDAGHEYSVFGFEGVG